MSCKKSTDKKRMDRLLDSEFTLNKIHKIRWRLLQLTHDIKSEEQWEYMEELLRKISGNDKIWYATNIEIYNYMQAQRRLVISADETMFYNPSDITVWVEKDKKVLTIDTTYCTICKYLMNRGLVKWHDRSLQNS